MTLVRRERPARTSPNGLLALLHGRGSDANDLFPLFDLIDPDQRLHCVTLQAPFQYQGMPGNHWYIVRDIGYPDAASFHASLEQITHDVDELLAEHRLDASRLVLGGFSQGSVMSIAVALAPGRPRIAALLPWSGFVPVVDGWEIDTVAAAGLPVVGAHGALDPVIDASFGRAARQQLENAGAVVTWHEPAIGHELDTASIAAARSLVQSLWSDDS
jgi:phospholipase/carboxylesterase